ncbi:hypothetical protein N480_09120 [Pseudoalteromonas luteoviolacea S2607]|nr:hypothetical protein N480_09120 [Pseudoalteromonas luteoviolacea S2607]
MEWALQIKLNPTKKYCNFEPFMQADSEIIVIIIS